MSTEISGITAAAHGDAGDDQGGDPSPTPPTKWRVTTLGKILRPRREKRLPSELPDSQYIGMEHVEPHSMRLLNSVPARSMRSSANRFYEGDVLYGRLRPYLNKVCKPDFEGLCSAEFIVLPKTAGIDPDFLKYRLNAIDFVRFASRLNAGDRPRVDFDQISSFEMSLPPLDEQPCIVAEIEKQFTRLDAGVASLKRVQVALKRYRASVLKAACEGLLVPTEAELARQRGTGNVEIETGEALLRLILAERHKNWNGRGKYKEPAAPDTIKLPPLPDGWTWASIEQLTHTVYRYPTFFGMEHLPDGVPVIRGEHLLPTNRISTDWSDYWFVARDVSAKYPKTVVEPGDIVMSVRGSVGKLGIVENANAGSQISPNCLRIALVHPFVLSKWFVTVFGSTAGASSVKGNVNQTTIETIKATVFVRTAVPLPPLGEQTRIVAEVERRLSVVEELEAVVSANLACHTAPPVYFAEGFHWGTLTQQR